MDRFYRFSWIPIFIIVFAVLAGCGILESKRELPIEMVAFGSLTKEESALIPVSPKDSTVRIIPVDDRIRSIIVQNYEREEVYAVSFHHTESLYGGRLTVLIDLDQKTVVGKGFIE